MAGDKLTGWMKQSVKREQFEAQALFAAFLFCHRTFLEKQNVFLASMEQPVKEEGRGKGLVTREPLTPVALPTSRPLPSPSTSPYRAEYIVHERVDNADAVQVTFPIALAVQHSTIPRSHHRTRVVVVTSTAERRKKLANRCWCINILVLAIVFVVCVAVNSVPNSESEA